MTKPAAFEKWPIDLNPGWAYRVSSDEVVDGDTFRGFVDLGLNQYAYETFRLEGYDAPEINSGPPHVRAWGMLTKEHLQTLLPLGTKMRGFTIKDAASFGRYRIVLELESDFFVNDLMMAWLHGQDWWPDYKAYKGWPE